jgi:hypothetical protein
MLWEVVVVEWKSYCGTGRSLENGAGREILGTSFYYAQSTLDTGWYSMPPVFAQTVKDVSDNVRNSIVTC